jgi:glycosyltransferase involved in cell wall biosynthesis
MVKHLFIAYYFPPMGGAGVQRVQKFVRYLPAEGFLPIVVAGPVSASGKWSPQDKTLLAEIPDSVRVHRVSGPVPGASSPWRRRWESISSRPNAFSRWWVQSATDLALANADGTSFVLATMPPFENAEVADSVSKQLGIPWVADLRDPWAVDEIQVFPSRLHQKLELRKMETLLAGASLIIMNTPEAAAALRRSLPRLDGGRIISITNGFDGEDFQERLVPRPDRKFRVVHAGSLLTDSGLQLRKQRIHRMLGGIRREVDVLTRSGVIFMQALASWVKANPAIGADLEVVFAGAASSADEAFAESHGVKSFVKFIGYLSHAQSVELVRNADMLFLPMHNLPAGTRATTAPGKTFEYMATGRPILAAVPDGDANDILRRCGTASICRPDDAAGMIAALDRAFRCWKRGESLPVLDRNFVNQFERRALTHSLAEALRAHLGLDTETSSLELKESPAVIHAI